MENEISKELRDDIKEEMWGNLISFLKEIDCESVADMCWVYNDDGAVIDIQIKFEHPIYLTVKNED